MFDWDDLRIFLAVARARKVAPAARALGIDATTIGRRLARLEQALEASLFETLGGERVLTERGQALMRHAESVESAALAAVEEVTGEERKLAGQVRLSVAEGFGTWILAPGLADFHARHPGIRLDLITASGFLNPSKREADMAVMLARPQRGRLSVRRLGDYRLHLYGAPSYLAEAGVPDSPGALREHALIGYVPEFIFSPELDYLDEVEAGLEAHLRSTSINMQHSMIAAGVGIGVLPDFIGRRDSSLVALMPQQVEIVRSFWLVTHGDLRNLARIEAVANWLQERVATLKPIDGGVSPR
ncbi:DNA-binding transcriptional LysR family regulator [Sphingobium fontiphilum]|uniref:DNA-binding transcriptional LysR family regulator n=1 Tax=Sphingobium fontiphilum TaxID=944425 RepID=A0A7W6DE96_9SPHN|nr:LysR family transcriptional regulator [Sphingobium fontiphilum]MBB3981112.1 DNA-binding transcriptional LysR family regulator [Sphingobium fontiphilum]